MSSGWLAGSWLLIAFYLVMGFLWVIIPIVLLSMNTRLLRIAVELEDLNVNLGKLVNLKRIELESPDKS